MGIYTTCTCGKQLLIPNALAGTEIRCRRCERAIAVPTIEALEAAEGNSRFELRLGVDITPEFIYSTCLNCGKRVKGPHESAGKRGFCPKCGDEVYMPHINEELLEQASAIRPSGAAAVRKIAQEEEERELPGGVLVEDPPTESYQHDEMPLSEFIHATPHCGWSWERFTVESIESLIQAGHLPTRFTRYAKAKAADARRGYFRSRETVREFRARVRRLRFVMWLEALDQQYQRGRKTINDNPALTMGLAIVLIVSCLFTMFLASRPVPPPELVEQGWYYDLATGELFKAPASLLPPIEAPSRRHIDGGPAGVRAFMFACGDCVSSQPFIGFLQTFTPEARAAIEKMLKSAKDGPSDSGTVKLDVDTSVSQVPMIRTLSKSVWYPVNSEAALGILNEVVAQCSKDNKLPVRCKPPAVKR